MAVGDRERIDSAVEHPVVYTWGSRCLDDQRIAIRRPLERQRRKFIFVEWVTVSTFDIDEPEALLLEILIDHIPIAAGLFVFFLLLGLCIGCGKSDGPAVRRPAKGANGSFVLCNRARLAAIHGDQINLRFTVLLLARGEEGDRLSVR